MRALSLIRILDVRQGDGTYVTSLDPQLLLEAIGFVVDFHRDDSVLEFLAVRRILEPAATAMAAARIGEQQLDALSAQLDRLGDSPPCATGTPRRRARGRPCTSRAWSSDCAPRCDRGRTDCSDESGCVPAWITGQ